jgi:hypothetical protein
MRLRPLLACLALSACSSVVPMTAARLSAMDPLTVDPGQIEVALILPQGLRVTPGSAVLTLSAQRGDQRIAGDFVLDERAVPGVPAPEGATVAGYGLTAHDVARMRALQAEIAAWKAEGEARGALSVGVGGCRVGEGPAPEAEGAVMIRLARDEAFHALIRPTPLVSILGEGALAAMGPCKGVQ